MSRKREERYGTKCHMHYTHKGNSRYKTKLAVVLDNCNPSTFERTRKENGSLSPFGQFSKNCLKIKSKKRLGI